MKSNLTSLEELNSIDSITTLIVSGSDKLENVDLRNLTNNYSLSFFDNLNLKTVSINNTFQTSTKISFYNNPLLNNLIGFENLENINAVSGGLKLSKNPLLTTTKAFNNVRFISNLRIIEAGFDSLQFNALENINDSLVIQDNALLSFCSIDAICDKVFNDSLVQINNNLADCTTQQEVINACRLISTDDTHIEKTLQLYPNPTDGILIVKSQEIHGNTTVKIMDLSGKICRKINLKGSSQINFEGLNPGIYFVEILNNQYRLIEKVILK